MTSKATDPRTGNEHRLDGARFIGRIRNRDGSSDEEEELLFQKGEIHSEVFEGDGFISGEYHAKPVGDRIRFTATCLNPRGERLRWKGQIVENDMEAIVSRVGRGGKTQVFDFEGRIQSPGRIAA